MNNNTVEMEMLFVEENKGEKDGKPYHVVKLGDPQICESANFFLSKQTKINTSIFSRGEMVRVIMKAGIFNGRMILRLEDILAV